MPFAEALALVRRGERWLLPGACLLCGGRSGDLAGDPLICALCCGRFRRLPEPQCARCGQPATEAGQPCRVCAAWPGGLRRVQSAVWLDDHARLAVHRLKYGGWWRVGEALAGVMTRALGLSLAGAELVPVPLGRRRARRRGYNQAEALARALAQAAGGELRTDRLARARETATQTALAPEARLANIAGAFRATGRPGARVVLVDDVFTTGATLVEAATTLLEAGAPLVEAVTFARARPPIG